MRGRSYWMTCLTACVVASIIPAMSSAALASQLLTYQGLITDPGGSPLGQPTDLAFSIFAAPTGGTPLWSETHVDVPMQGGVFAVLLGSVTPLPESVFENNSALWLETAVEGAPLTPRRRFGSVPFAVVADTALREVWKKDGTNAVRLTGDVGIGITNPLAKLHVNGRVIADELTILGYSEIVCTDRLHIQASEMLHLQPFMGQGDVFVGGGGGQARLLVNTNVESVNGDLVVQTAARGLVLRSPNGTWYRVTVNNSGVLSTSPVSAEEIPAPPPPPAPPCCSASARSIGP